MAGPVFETLREGMAALSAELKKPETLEALKAIGYEIAEIVKVGMGMLRWAVQNADTLSAMAHAAGILGVALAAMKIAQVTTQLGAWAIALVTGSAALDRETSALTRNTVAHAVNTAARGASGGSGLSRAMTIFGDAAPFASTGFAPRAGATAEEAMKMAMMGQAAAQMGKVRTVFPEFGAVTNPGVWMNNAGSLRGAVGQAGLGLGGRAALAAGSGGGEAAIAAALVAIGAALGAWTDSIHKATEAQETKTRTSDAMGGNGLDRMNALMDATMGADSRNRDIVERELKKQIIIEEEGAKIDGQRGDLAAKRRDILKEMLGYLDSFVVTNNEALDQEAAQAQADEKRAEAFDKAIEHQEYEREQAARQAQSAEAIQQATLQDANPTQKMGLLQGMAMQQRTNYRGVLPDVLSGLNAETASPTQMMSVADSIRDQPQYEELMKSATKLADILRQIAALNEQSEKAVEDECVKEGELAAKKQETLDTMAAQKTLLQAQAAGDVTAAVAAQRRMEIEAQIKTLIAGQVDAIEARRIAEEQAELKAQAARSEALKSLNEQHAIEEARVQGNTALVESLERQRDIEREMRALEGQGLSHDEARQMATQAAADKDAVRDRDRGRKLEEIQAGDEVDSQRAHHHRTGTRHAEDNAFELKRRHELEDQGYDPDTVNSTLNKEMATRRRSRGTIGGPTGRAGAADSFGKGLTPDDVWARQFASNQGPSGTALDAGRSRGGFGGGLTADADWRKLFPKALGDVMPEPANRPGGNVAGSDTGGGGSGAQAATQAVDKAGKDGQAAAKSLTGAGQNLSKAMKDVEESAKKDLGAVNAAIESLKGTLSDQLTQMQSQIDSLNEQVAAL